MDAKPFDITKIEEEVQAGVAEANDSIGKVSGMRRSQARNDDRSNSGGPRSLPKDITEALQATRSVEEHDAVNHPLHYVSHPSGVECIIITEWMNFNLGNAMKYIWRSNDKGTTIQDLEKARWYLDREISRLNRLAKS